jgi:Spy/CpxP family protein refolding chaperone
MKISKTFQARVNGILRTAEQWARIEDARDDMRKYEAYEAERAAREEYAAQLERYGYRGMIINTYGVDIY